MTPQDMARLHAAAFAPQRGWSAQEFQSLCASPHVRCLSRTHGFALVRTLAGETELLTLAVDPQHRRKGIANRILCDWLGSTDAQTAFLDVAADNAPARALYALHGFAETGRRKSYYHRPDAPPVDAVLMQAAVTHRQGVESSSHTPKTG